VGEHIAQGGLRHAVGREEIEQARFGIRRLGREVARGDVAPHALQGRRDGNQSGLLRRLVQRHHHHGPDIVLPAQW